MSSYCNSNNKPRCKGSDCTLPNSIHVDKASFNAMPSINLGGTSLFSLLFSLFSPVYLNKCLAMVLSISLFLFSSALWAESNAKRLTIGEGLEKLKWEVGLVAGGATYLGLANWNWGSSNDFNTNREGWFGMDTGSGGVDKLGHMYTTYVMDEFFTHRLHSKTHNWRESARLSAYFAGATMLLVEVFDGYSDDHGFSYEDMVMNSAGIGLSYLRNTVPGLRDKVDFRLEYKPSEGHGNRYLTDYSGMRYIAAIKPAGFANTKHTPLKYFELQLGYQADGFKSSDRDYLDRKRTDLSIGLAFDLQELLFKPIKRHMNHGVIDVADTLSRYYQIPNSTLKTTIHEREEAIK